MQTLGQLPPEKGTQRCGLVGGSCKSSVGTAVESEPRAEKNRCIGWLCTALFSFLKIPALDSLSFIDFAWMGFAFREPQDWTCKHVPRGIPSNPMNIILPRHHLQNKRHPCGQKPSFQARLPRGHGRQWWSGCRALGKRWKADHQDPIHWSPGDRGETEACNW